MVKRTICLLLALFLLSATPAFAAVQPPDGQYLIDVTMTGGTGRVTMDSPCHIQVENGLATATVVLSSKNYEYMLVDGQYYYATKGDETSSFEIPIVLDEKMKIAAQTTAMGEPHEIEYVLTFDSATMKADKQDAPQVMYAVIGGTALFLAIGAVVVIRKKK